MKFDQLIECNMRNIFPEKPYTKCGEEVSPRLFYKKSKFSIPLDQLSEMLWRLFLLYYKKSKFSIPLDQLSEMLWRLFLLYGQVDVYQNILKLRWWPLAFTLCKVFLKHKKRSRTSLPTSFLHGFWRKIFLKLYFRNWTNFIGWLPLHLEILGNMCIVIIFCPV